VHQKSGAHLDIVTYTLKSGFSTEMYLHFQQQGVVAVTELITVTFLRKFIKQHAHIYIYEVCSSIREAGYN